jgi:alpha-beta hydrolase superfamily lysophospholipase
MESPAPWSVFAEALFGWDLMRGALSLPALAAAPRGAGERVLVLPGFAASDASTAVMRLVLRSLGHDARGWELGRNLGDVERLVPRVDALVARHAEETGRPVRLVGWSLGGVIAREVARDRPELVERIVTLGSPIRGGPKYTATAATFRRRGVDLDAIEARIAARERKPIEVPVAVIYSRRDGIVSWRACIDETNPFVEHHEVAATHTGLGFQADVLAVVARALVANRERSAATA